MRKKPLKSDDLIIGVVEVITDSLTGATAGLSSSVFHPCTAGQASSGTQAMIPLCYMRTENDGTFENWYKRLKP